MEEKLLAAKSEYTYMGKKIRISAVGDIAFVGPFLSNPSEVPFESVAPLLIDSDLTVGNLEHPLLNEGTPVIGKCTLKGNPDWANILNDIGIGVVSLANNHMMDYGAEGLITTMEVLEKAGIQFMGAGRNIFEAVKPLFLKVNGYRVAFLARSDVDVKSKCYASEDFAGVARYDEEETRQAIHTCRKSADVVILLIHWGIEEYVYPSPQQRSTARDLIISGADLILGHHPHVLQGMERFSGGYTAYSLGNFVFNDFDWTFNWAGEQRQMHLRLKPENRQGIILRIDIDSGNEKNVSTVLTKIDQEGRLCIDPGPTAFKNFQKLSKRLSIPFYQRFWKFYAIHREWELRFEERLSLGNILCNFRKIRLRHIRELFRRIKSSMNIALGKSTNPYD